jgi:antitoxin (DNA-binding transcriptional repressor) of toxin-antitoxin stability system
VTVFDRDTPVARIIPIAAPSLEVRKAKRPLRDLKLPPKPSKRTDSTAVLVDDRRRR